MMSSNSDQTNSSTSKELEGVENDTTIELPTQQQLRKRQTQEQGHETASSSFPPSSSPSSPTTTTTEFSWTAITIIQSIGLFGLAGIAEILGGWMVWMAIRGNNANGKKPWWYAILGSILLITYGFIPCLQPLDSFGRIYAAYGGFFIVLSFVFGWILDGDRPDLGDMVGGSVALVGVFLILFWPREQETEG